MRLFLAIELPDDVRAHLLNVRQRLEDTLPKVAYTRGENLHVTLKFLGEVEPKLMAQLAESLEKIKPQRSKPHAAQIDCFPNRGPVRIVAAALDGTLAPLRALVQGIEQRCHYLGFEKEQRAYRPHVTIARARPTLSPKFRAGITEITSDLWPGPAFEPQRFVLMQSQMSPGGSIYSVVASFPVGAE